MASRPSLITVASTVLLVSVGLGAPAAWSTTPTTTLVSATRAGAPTTGGLGSTAVSANGRYVAFVSGATDLVRGDTNGVDDVFVRDLATATTTRVSVSTSNVQANGTSWDVAISDDGRLVAFTTQATDLGGTEPGLDRLYVRDTAAHTTTLVSGHGDGDQGYNGVQSVAMSGDGRYIAYAMDKCGEPCGVLYVRDLQAGRTTPVYLGLPGAGQWNNSAVAISQDGRYISVESQDLYTGYSYILVRDRTEARTTWVSVDRAGHRVAAGSGAMSGSGRFVVFDTNAPGVVAGDTDTVTDVFVRDLVNRTTTRVSVNGSGLPVNADSGAPPQAISRDGRCVAFTSIGTNLVLRDTNGTADTFVRDRWSHSTRRISLTVAGRQTAGGSGNNALAMSADATAVVFASDANGIVPAAGNGVYQYFARSGLPSC